MVHKIYTFPLEDVRDFLFKKKQEPQVQLLQST